MANFNPLPISSQCDVTPCLFRVAGAGFEDTDAQISACQSIFGFPLVPTVTLPADPVYSTVAETSIYTDIIVETSTVVSTVDQTSISYSTLTQTTVDYTTTIVDTVTATVPAVESDKRRVRRRRGCRGANTSSQPTSSQPTPTSSASSIAYPSQCDSEQDYSSACACLVPATVTSYYDAVTSIVFATDVSTVTSAVETTATVDVTTVIIDPEITTVVATLETQTVATTTTTVPAAPASTPIYNLGAFTLTVSGNDNDVATVIQSGPFGSVQLVSGGTPTTFTLSQGVLLSSTIQGYILMQGASYGDFLFTTPALASVIGSNGNTILSPTCSIDSVSHLLSCSTSSGLSQLATCGSAQDLSLTNMSPDASCVAVQLQAAF